MHITLTGNLGSGKSTVCKILKEEYGFEIYSTGTVQRKIAEEMNMTTLEFNQLMCSDKKYDSMIDDATTRISRESKDKDIVFDSRLAWNFVEDSFKVFLSVSLDIAATRVMNDSRGAVESYKSIEEAKELLSARAETENKRYKDIYGLEYFNFNNYNLVLDSTYCTPDVVAKMIMEEAKLHEEKRKTEPNIHETKILVSPLRLVSLESITEAEKQQLQELVEEYKNVKKYGDELIKVSKEGNQYKVLENLEKVKAMALANVSFVSIAM